MKKHLVFTRPFSGPWKSSRSKLEKSAGSPILPRYFSIIVPHTKTIQLDNWNAIRKLYAYLQNSRHPNHAEYTITKMRSAHATLTPIQLMAEVEKTFRKMTSEKRVGKPIKNLFTLHICRMPDGAWPTPEEREEFARHYVSTIAPDGLAMWTWHVNRGMGSDDLNVFAANLISLEHPRARRRSDINHINEARDIADTLTENLNRKRRQQGRRLILTMPERLRQIAAEKRGTSIEEQLAHYPRPVYLQNLRTVLEELGHEVTRLNADNDSISIRLRHPGEDVEKAGKRRAKRFRLTALLGDVARLRKTRARASEVVPQINSKKMRAKGQTAAFDLSNYEELKRLVRELVREQELRASQLSQVVPQLTPEKVRAAEQATAGNLTQDEEIERLVKDWSRKHGPDAPGRSQEPPQAPGRGR